jgi:hypothetical protein
MAMITEEAIANILALHRQGHSMRFIAKRLGRHRDKRDAGKKIINLFNHR